jgi:DNA-binding MarR family transcriptional regulator
MYETLGLEDQVIVALRRISRAIDLHSRVLLQKHGLTAPQLAALKAVGRLQPVTVGKVARAIHLSFATVTGIFNRLEARRLVRRSRDGRDRRSVVVELTGAGDQLLQSAPSLLQERFRQQLVKLQQWEQTQLLASLQRIAAMMDAETIEAAPVLSAGVVTASPEDISLYLEKAVKPSEESLPVEPPPPVPKGESVAQDAFERGQPTGEGTTGASTQS